MARKRLKARVINTNRRATQKRATVIDVAPNRATVRLAGRGAVLTMLSIAGGSVKVGDRVMVDYSGERPLVKAVI